MVSVGIMSQFANHSHSSDSENDTVTYISPDAALVAHEVTAAVSHDATAAIVQRDVAPTFSNILITNSRGTHVGNNTFYQAPMYKTNQFVNANCPNKATEDVGVVDVEQNEVLLDDNKVCFNKDDLKASPGVFKDRLVKVESAAPDLVYNKKSHSNARQIKILSCPVFCVIMLICVIPNVIFLLNSDTTDSTDKPVDDTTATAGENNDSTTHAVRTIPRVLPRDAWGGFIHPLNNYLLHPTPLVIITHCNVAFCKSYPECSNNLMVLQAYYMKAGFPDMVLNFCIGGDGFIYEGRGWHVPNPIKNNSIIIGFIGQFEYDELTNEMIESAEKLLDDGVTQGILPANYELVAGNQTYPTENPGKNVYKIIKTWPHFHFVELGIDFL